MIARGQNGGIVQNFGVLDEVVFLEISLTENWLIFITRANGPFWSSIPSWQLAGAILLVDLLATFFTLFGFFLHGHQTSIVAVVRIWIFSFGIFCIMGGVYYLLQDSVGFDNLMHGKSPKKNQKQRSLEDFGRSSRTSRIIPLVSYPSANVFHSCLAPTCFHPTRKILIDIASSAPCTLSMRAW
jgi:H+-transporting ATPase